jgi:hypothetical protein
VQSGEAAAAIRLLRGAGGARETPRIAPRRGEAQRRVGAAQQGSGAERGCRTAGAAHEVRLAAAGTTCACRLRAQPQRGCAARPKSQRGCRRAGAAWGRARQLTRRTVPFRAPCRPETHPGALPSRAAPQPYPGTRRGRLRHGERRESALARAITLSAPLRPARARRLPLHEAWLGAPPPTAGDIARALREWCVLRSALRFCRRGQAAFACPCAGGCTTRRGSRWDWTSESLGSTRCCYRPRQAQTPQKEARHANMRCEKAPKAR